MISMVLGVVWLGGCAGSSGKEGSGALEGGSAMSVESAIKALRGDWKLAGLNGRDVPAVVGPEGTAPGISIAADGGFSGYTGVNRMASKLDVASLAAGEFSLGGIATTRMAGPAEAMELEQAFTSALGKVRAFAVKGDALTLTGGDGTLLRFGR